MSAIYAPGQLAQQYEALTEAQRAEVNKQADQIFTERTGVTRMLDADGDTALRRRWLRIRDEVMATRLRPTKKPSGPRVPGSVLWGSVGEGGENFERDVRVIQRLMNSIPNSLIFDDSETFIRLPDGTVEIVVNTLAPTGRISRTMIEWIYRFQKRAARMVPDGLIEPGGSTMRAIMDLALRSGHTIRLRPEAVAAHIDRSGFHKPQPLNAFLADIVFRRGDIVPGLDGRRLLLSINNYTAVFILLDHANIGSGYREFNPMRGKLWATYLQETDAFVAEYNTFCWVSLSQDLNPIATAIEAEIAILTGIAAGLTGTTWAFAAVSGTDFYLRNRKKFKHWYHLGQAVLDARANLKVYAPILYDKLYQVIMTHYVDSADPADIAFAIGRLLGNLGEQALTRRFTVLGTVFTLVLQVTILILKMIPSAIAEAQNEWNRGIRTFANSFSELGVKLTVAEQIAIFNEIRANPQIMRMVVEELVRAYRIHGPHI